LNVPHPAFTSEAVDRLRTLFGTNGAAPLPGHPEQVPGMAAKARLAAKRVVRKAIAWYVDAVAQDTADRAIEKFASQQRERDEMPVLKVNHELLKGEVRALLHTVEELGLAIAPATGLDGAAARMAELREGLHAVERRLRTMSEGVPPAPVSASASPSAAPATLAPAPSLEGFDYTAFERRFRGDSETVLAELKERYFELLRANEPVLDVGCGRGEMLAALAAEGIAGRGVDNDAGMVAEAVERGVDVACDDAIAYLRSVPERSLGAVVAIQVLEHLPFGMVVRLVDLVRSRLRPGGVFIAETPNPASLVVLGNSYILDPTHVRPLHPSLAAFLCENAGFRDVRLLFWAPAEDYQLGPVADPEVNAAFDKLNRVLFGPQDYAVVATTPPA
jgi:SAM-dependent methyltransferase